MHVVTSRHVGHECQLNRVIIALFGSAVGELFLCRGRSVVLQIRYPQNPPKLSWRTELSPRPTANELL
jgi:hypothetical protein